MEHPLIGDINNLTIDELSARVSDLSNKLNMAAGTGNAHLCDQIRMAMETFRNKYQEKLQDSYKKEKETSHINFDDKINIK
jgi:DNA-binding ferritin-like protein (Dps family)